ASWLTAQPGAAPDPSMVVLACPDDGKILLRWAPQDHDIWALGNQYGYKIERFTTSVNGEAIPLEDLYATRVLLIDALLPLVETEWDNQFSNNNNATIAKGVLHDESIDVSLDGDPSLAEIVEQMETKNSRVIFGLYVAEQDFAVAKGMALGFEDLTPVAGETYFYKVSVNSPDQRITGGNTTSLAEVPDLQAPQEVGAEGGNQVAIIRWNTAVDDEQYSSYVVERSSDNVNFAPTSDLPYLFSAEADVDDGFAYYKDSLANNEDLFYYRVRGKTPFCKLGPPSASVSVKGVPDKLPMILRLEDAVVEEDQVTLAWDNFDDALNPQIQGFNIQRSEDALHHFERINNGLLSPTTRSYNDEQPLGTAYYRLEVIDQNGYEYHSPAQLAQLPDSEPPAVPTGLSGTFVTSNTLVLNWSANQEDDLKGYRLFVANLREATYTQITSQDVLGETFVYEIDPKFMVDSIYIKILASDQRSNYSDLSVPLVLARPDVTPPSSPVLHKAIPTPEGIELGWRFSSSKDVVYHELQRKRQNAPNWESVLTIPLADQVNFQQNITPNSLTATCYLDDASLEIREYDYRLLAFDEAANASSSDLLSVRPYDSGLRGSIDQFALDIACVPSGNIPQATAFEILQLILQKYEIDGSMDYGQVEQLVYHNIITANEYNSLLNETPGATYDFLNQRKIDYWGDQLRAEITLHWDYEAASQLQDFQLYRSAEGSALMLYKTLSVAELSEYVFIDEDVRPGRRYFYQLLARHLNGGYSEMSAVIMAKVPGF
ncbi:MAG: hypothetical protein AAGD05_06065, partial [Bacteroidota bacterium]